MPDRVNVDRLTIIHTVRFQLALPQAEIAYIDRFAATRPLQAGPSWLDGVILHRELGDWLPVVNLDLLWGVNDVLPAAQYLIVTTAGVALMAQHYTRSAERVVLMPLRPPIHNRALQQVALAGNRPIPVLEVSSLLDAIADQKIDAADAA